MNTPSSTFTSIAILYLLNAMWQIPLIFAAASIASLVARPTGSHTVHRIWVIAFFAEATLPAFHLNPEALMSLWSTIMTALAWPWRNHASKGEVHILTGPSTVAGGAGLHLPPSLVTVGLVAWICITFYFAACLAWGLYRTHTMRGASSPLTNRLQNKIDVSLAAINAQDWTCIIAVSSQVAGPATVGFRNPVLLFPQGFLDKVSEQDLRAILAHEHAHMRRNDFAKNLLYKALSLAVAFHPMFWLTRSRLAESREILCDEMAAACLNERDSRESYAKSLLNLANTLYTHRPSTTIHAIGIFDANIFERRIMQLIRKPIALPRGRRTAIAAVCAGLALTTATSALAFHINTLASRQDQATSSRIKVDIDKLTIVSKVMPIYPPEEKKKGTTGTVVLAAIIGKSGAIENLNVRSSPSEGLSRSALDAVHQWRYQPYLLNGDPIEVETTISVVYNLGK